MTAVWNLLLKQKRKKTPKAQENLQQPTPPKKKSKQNTKQNKTKPNQTKPKKTQKTTKQKTKPNPKQKEKPKALQRMLKTNQIKDPNQTTNVPSYSKC